MVYGTFFNRLFVIWNIYLMAFLGRDALVGLINGSIPAKRGIGRREKTSISDDVGRSSTHSDENESLQSSDSIYSFIFQGKEVQAGFCPKFLLTFLPSNFWRFIRSDIF